MAVERCELMLQQPFWTSRHTHGQGWTGEAGVAVFGKLQYPFQEEQRLFIEKLISIQWRSSSVTRQNTWANVSVAHLACHMLCSCFNWKKAVHAWWLCGKMGLELCLLPEWPSPPRCWMGHTGWGNKYGWNFQHEETVPQAGWWSDFALNFPAQWS